MKQSNKQFAIALYEATREIKDSEIATVANNFVLLLSKAHKLKRADKIMTEFIKYAKKQEGIMDIEITGARELDKKTIEEIKKVFGERTQSVQTTNPDLIGGIVVKTENVIFDASLKTQINNLKNIFST
ncbi:MAG: ATP synthase F1 subunit delta [Candidatus Magasanikbacteria bacterium CG10_big_fil_rev_8_21_14_0_10_40_10]|uniref:ATP synthase F1 subunit delta n=1 Tax=Candidatus Magasanikbacteria bacterium CG10_big_fil_rev_8_21_14_0_10_40_10 TaxID=1974648 RepID=A0A2M6W4X6_9BACT|nr:MAG: ATP synthase F1 subunit delta [Candidatus Magasanikbacteria bacterium CG10_big_fil_rev_8_21_14_0_10_40_10]